MPPTSGFLAITLSALLANYFFIEPVHVFSIAEPAGFLALLLFVLVGFVIVSFIESLWLTIDRSQATEQMFREAFETAAVGRAQGHHWRRDRHCVVNRFSISAASHSPLKQ